MNEQDVVKIIEKYEQNGLYGMSNASHAHNGIDSPRVQFRTTTSSLFSTSTVTTKTAPVFVFTSSNAPINATVTGMFLIANDTTAGNISAYNVQGGASRTIATIAKGTSAGVLVGATTLSNSTSATSITVQSDSAGNATVVLLYST